MAVSISCFRDEQSPVPHCDKIDLRTGSTCYTIEIDFIRRLSPYPGVRVSFDGRSHLVQHSEE